MRLMAAVMAVLFASAGAAAASQEPEGVTWGAPEIFAAFDKARKGDSETLKWLNYEVKGQRSWKPEKKDLPKYHDCLGTNENPLVQEFAIRAIRRLKDTSSIEPLQNFVTTARHLLYTGTVSDEEEYRDPAKAAQRKLKGGLLSDEAAAYLRLALVPAVDTLGEIDGDNDSSVAFFSTLLKSDSRTGPKLIVAYYPLWNKGRPGLKLLLEESRTAQDSEIGYISEAVSKINDPALVGDLYAACLDTKYPGRVRGSALWAIAGMRGKAPEAEQRVIDILMNEKSDLRAAAVRRVGEFGTESGLACIQDLRNTTGNGDEELIKAINETLSRYDAGWCIKEVLSPVTSDEEKQRLCSALEGMDKEKIAQHASTLEACLNIKNAKGQPLNAARVCVWRALYRATGVKHPLTLAYGEEPEFESETCGLRKELLDSYSRSGRVPKDQREKKAMEDVRQVVKKWVNPQMEKTGEVK
jgi:HEAT repeat protein